MVVAGASQMNGDSGTTPWLQLVVPVVVGSLAGAMLSRRTGQGDWWWIGVFGGATVSAGYATSTAARSRYERGEGMEPR